VGFRADEYYYYTTTLVKEFTNWQKCGLAELRGSSDRSDPLDYKPAVPGLHTEKFEPTLNPTRP